MTTSQKRRLLDNEIADIVNSIPIVGPSHFKTSSHAVVVDRLREQLRTIELYPSMFDKFKQSVIDTYHKSLIPAGENVGILTAQSLGERFTQNTLNSVAREEPILYCDFVNAEVVIEPIGEFVDRLMTLDSSDVYTILPNTDVFDLASRYAILSTTPDGKTVWRPITSVTRHDVPAGEQVVRVSTKTGKSVVASLHKSFIKRQHNQLVQNTAGNLAVGDLVPIVQHAPALPDNIRQTYRVFALGYTLGRIRRPDVSVDGSTFSFTDASIYDLGMFTACKSDMVTVNTPDTPLVSPNSVTITTTQHCASIPQFIWTSSSDCMRGYLLGLFGSAASFAYNGPSARFVVEVAELLTRFGIVSRIVGNVVTIVNTADFVATVRNNLSVSNFTLDDRIPGVHTQSKSGTIARADLVGEMDDILAKTARQTVYYDEIVDIEYIDYAGKLYDLSVEETMIFATLGGFLVYDTFHSAGLTVKTVVTGVPRFIELMNTSKEPKQSNCTFTVSKTEYPQFGCIGDVREYIGDSLRGVTLHDILVDYTITSWHDACAESWWLADLKWTDEAFPLPTRILRLHLDHKRVYLWRLSLSRIVANLNSVLVDVFSVCSSPNECIIDMVNLCEQQLGMSSPRIGYITEENKMHVFWEDLVLPRLKKHVVAGLDKIRDFVIVASHSFREWEVTTVGSNFKALLESDKFDFRHIKSNNMWEVYNVLGIEAAREFLIREFSDVMSSDGSFINKCHVALLVDTMVQTGDITSISRYSLRSKPSVLSRTSFEESIENFLKAGFFGERDDMASISSNIMTGKLSRIGTGICDLLMTDDVFENTVREEAVPEIKFPYAFENSGVFRSTTPSEIVDVLPELFT